MRTSIAISSVAFVALVLAGCGDDDGDDGDDGGGGAPEPLVLELTTYVKPSNPGNSDVFGRAAAISGKLIVVGAPQDKNRVTAVNAAPDDGTTTYSGSAFIFGRSETAWGQEAYIKAQNAEFWTHRFGCSVAISEGTVVLGARSEGSNGTDGPSDNTMASAGAAYVFE